MSKRKQRPINRDPSSSGPAPKQTDEPDAQQIDCLLSLFNAGRCTEAARLAEKMIERFPLCGLAWKVLGASFGRLGRLEEALLALEKASTLLPPDAETHSNLGTVLMNLHRLPEAEACYRRALKIHPHAFTTLYNLGAVFRGMGRWNEAEACYRRALKTRPDAVEALNALALLLHFQGRPSEALPLIRHSLECRETQEAKALFVECLPTLSGIHQDNALRAFVIRALTEPWGQPRQMAWACATLVKHDPTIRAGVTRAVAAWPQRLSARELFGDRGLIGAAEPLLCALLKTTLINDRELERYLTMARLALLEAAGMATGMEAGTDLGFSSALAQQCFINEYVYAHTVQERKKARALCQALQERLERSEPFPVIWLPACAAYFPLHTLPATARLLDRQWPSAVIELLDQQVKEPCREEALRPTLLRLTPLRDEVSRRVRDQYEEHPYPRWVRTPALRPMSLSAVLRQKCPRAALPSLIPNDHSDILVAGCGTGLHPIGTAQRIQGCRVLAVDLSLASLSYAQRKTEELGITSITYAQADLLEMGTIGQHFDLIEAVGVLHHLADPLTGWRILLSLLRPGGFMKLGFYSALARRHIVLLRQWIAERGYGETAEEIRRCRQDLLDGKAGVSFASVSSSIDFFSTSTCRDLLFHRQEQLLSVADIDAFLREEGLAFLGFEIDPQVILAYERRFPGDPAACDLEQWQQFEAEHPDTFFRMYQFWIWKPG